VFYHNKNGNHQYNTYIITLIRYIRGTAINIPEGRTEFIALYSKVVVLMLLGFLGTSHK